MDYQAYLRSPQWAEKRKQVWERDNGVCQWCGRQDGQRDVHHLSYQHIGHEPLDHLILICHDCHANYHEVALATAPDWLLDLVLWVKGLYAGLMRNRRVIFDDIDAWLLYRAARLGIKGLANQEKGRARLALDRLNALKENMKKRDTKIIELVREEDVYQKGERQ